MSEQPRTVEPVPVTLTRMEGTLNLLAYQMTEIKDDVRHIGNEVELVKARVGAVELAQAQSHGANQTWKSWLPVILTAIGLVAGAFYFSAR